MSAAGSLEALATSVDAMLNELIEQYAERLDAGETLDLEQCVHEHPEYAEQLRKLLPTMQVLAELGHSSDSKGASRISATADGDAATGILGDFHILREIGRGGMGVVYEAEQISLGRRVALKVLPFAATMDKRQLQRFLNEARAAAWLRHAHIVPVYAVGCTRGVNYYAMQLIEGQSLETLLQTLREKELPASPPDNDSTFAQPRLAAKSGDTTREPRAHNSTLKSSNRSRDDWRRVAELAVQAAEALEHAHQSGVVHRDVKPANLLLDENGDLWVTDFGLAQSQTDTRLTLTGDLLGTLRYMSPEQALAKRVIVDHRTDIYSLGATFYELATLKPVFAGQDRQELLRQIAFEEPVAPRRLNRAIPLELETIILKAVEKNPVDRYTTAKEMADDLKRFLNDEPTLAQRPTLWQRGRKWSRRHVAAVRAASIAVVVILAALTAMAGAWFGERANRQGETERAINATLRDADRLQNERKMPEALAKAQQAQAILAGGASTPDLTQRIESRLADLKFVADLEEIRGQRAVDYKQEGFNFADADRSYAQAFRAFGIDVDALAPDQAAALIRQRTVAVELAAALDDWSYVIQQLKPDNEARWKRLLTVAIAADPDVIRNAVRQALDKLDGKGLKTLQIELPVQDLPPATLFAIAKARAKTGNPEEALKLLRDGQRRYPADFWIAYELAIMLYQQTPPNYDEAICFGTVAIVLRPGSAPAHLSLGFALVNKGQLDNAIAAFREAIRLKPDYHHAYGNLGRALGTKGKLDEAIEAFQNAIRLKPDSATDQHQFGNVLLLKGQLDLAIAAYREAMRLKSDYWEAHDHFGMALQKKGELDNAIVAYREAISIKRDYWQAYRNLASALKEKGDPDKAIAVYREAIRLKSDDAEIHFNLGNTLHAKGKGPLDDAIACYQEAIRLKKDHVGAHNNLGIALKAKGRLDDAITCYQEAIRLKKDYAGVHNNLGIALKAKGRFEEAMASFRQAIAMEPEIWQPYRALASLLITCADPKLRDSKAAVALAKKLVDLTPEDRASWNTLGVSLYANGDWKDAVEALNKSVGLSEEGGRCVDFFPLAMAHWQLGDKEHARKWYDLGVERMADQGLTSAEVLRVRAEAAELLGIQEANAKDKKSLPQKK